jgi:hypothetical protein
MYPFSGLLWFEEVVVVVFASSSFLGFWVVEDLFNKPGMLLQVGIVEKN